MRQQQALQVQLEQQKVQQEEIMARLADKGLLATQNPDETINEEMGNLLQETQSKATFFGLLDCTKIMRTVDDL